ncbi:response regulator transcription factor [Sinorhizobium mexicanum]|uniref:Response regulator transcription factor n=1 Tax=Sinorhizobium mexicanum TaxID=375549 RepID=A0A859QW78_9HYPH|nr:response regulator transcription factor [Sinorhizobium mexicanum]MBP1881815.1 FixJ family two-component response regulator [Sinorhizobium mexicanum]QLL61568.1 response regulator transcription factor [Sinorhizobium mexicanum]
MSPQQTSPEAVPTVHIIEDDEAFRESLTDLFRSADIAVVTYPNTADFLNSAGLRGPGCLLLDVRLPGVNGLDFQSELERTGIRMPIIFMTGYGDIPMSVRAMKAGALDFLAKPFGDRDVLDAVREAFEVNAKRQQQSELIGALAARYRSLTQREREVMQEVVKGLMNKQIAFNLGISEITVKIHRGNGMRKMEAKSVTDLVKKFEMLEANQPHTDV